MKNLKVIKDDTHYLTMKEKILKLTEWDDIPRGSDIEQDLLDWWDAMEEYKKLTWNERVCGKRMNDAEELLELYKNYVASLNLGLSQRTKLLISLLAAEEAMQKAIAPRKDVTEEE